MKVLKIISLLIVLAFMVSCDNATKGDVDSAKSTALLGLLPAAASDTTASCMGCHSETTTNGQKIKWAQAGWEESVHKNGYRVPIYGITSVQVSAISTPSTNTWGILGYEWEGSDAFYSNGSGCQVCHTKQGFRKKIAGEYAGTTDPYNNKLTNNLPAVSAGSALVSDPNTIDCFACHSPHQKGSFDVLIPNGTSVTLESGAVYSKSQGNLCASCHQARLGGKETPLEKIKSDLTGTTGNASVNRVTGHYGLQTDVLLGKGGAEFSGQTYSNGTHTSLPNANCVNCHMANDFTGTNITETRNLSPAVGGHSFTATGIVHGAPKANAAGCAYTGCHSLSTATSQAAATTGLYSATATATIGHRPKGAAYIQKDGLDPFAGINTAMKAMANPETNCSGLIATAYAMATVGNKALVWDTYLDGTTIKPTCKLPSTTVAKYAAPADADEKVKFLMATWNYSLVLEDKSYGVHNQKYLAQLAYDSCEALKAIVADTTTSCGTRP